MSKVSMMPSRHCLAPLGARGLRVGGAPVSAAPLAATTAGSADAPAAAPASSMSSALGRPRAPSETVEGRIGRVRAPARQVTGARTGAEASAARAACRTAGSLQCFRNTGHGCVRHARNAALLPTDIGHAVMASVRGGAAHRDRRKHKKSFQELQANSRSRYGLPPSQIWSCGFIRSVGMRMRDGNTAFCFACSWANGSRAGPTAMPKWPRGTLFGPRPGGCGKYM